MDRCAMNFDIYPQCKPISMLLKFIKKTLIRKAFIFSVVKTSVQKRIVNKNSQRFSMVKNTTYVPYTMFVIYGEFQLINVNIHFLLKFVGVTFTNKLYTRNSKAYSIAKNFIHKNWIMI